MRAVVGILLWLVSAVQGSHIEVGASAPAAFLHLPESYPASSPGNSSLLPEEELLLVKAQGKRTQTFLGWVLLGWLGATGVVVVCRLSFPDYFHRQVLIGIFFGLWFVVGLSVYTTQPWLQESVSVPDDASMAHLRTHLGEDGLTLVKDLYMNRKTVAAGYKIHECAAGLWREGDLPNIDREEEVHVLCRPPSTIKFARKYTVVMALYLMAEIASTVGFGDLCPVNWSGQLFTTVFALYSTLLAAGILCEVGARFMRANSEVLQSRMAEELDALEDNVPAMMPKKKDNRAYLGLVSSLIVFLLVILLSTLFFVFYCEPDYYNPSVTVCEEKTWVQGFYMSVITTTTVGFGDLTPSTPGGRVFAIFLCLLGVGAFVNFAAAFADLVFKDSSQVTTMHLRGQAIEALETDEDGKLMLHELYRFILVEHELVEESVLDQLDATFEQMAKGRDHILASDFPGGKLASKQMLKSKSKLLEDD
mmetsp:Transcript_50905/g.111509  ORF Transcript_50905/g.111509 Transcript_50905/m.111509 type:complete len:477 (+) Transcript_50905:127-1557(+)